MRYYYTEPLAVAWMSRFYGMTFEASADSVGEYYELFYGAGNVPDVKNDVAKGRFYVAEESMHILKPKVFDLVTNIGMAAWRIRAISDSDKGNILHHIGGPTTLESDAVILMRGSVHFIWPETDISSVSSPSV